LGGGRDGHARAKKQENHNPVSHAESTPPVRTAVGSTSNGLDLHEVPPNSTPRQTRPLAGQRPSIAADPPTVAWRPTPARGQRLLCGISANVLQDCLLRLAI
jgi:hypothetical protein